MVCVWFIWSTRNRFIFRQIGFTYQGAWNDLVFLISEVGGNIGGHRAITSRIFLRLRHVRVAGIPRIASSGH